MMRTCQAILISVLALAAPRNAEAQTTWHVDDDCAPPGAGTEADPFCTIQNGVDASRDGDTVLVHPGTYTGDGNRDIRLFGKRIVLTSLAGPSETIIDIQGGPTAVHTGFRLTDGETSDAVIDGLSIINGYLVGDTGGFGVLGGGGGAAIFIKDGSPTIHNCIMRDNFADLSNIPWVYDARGGAILIEGGSSTVIENCVLVNNTGNFGGGIYVHRDCFVTLRNCLIAANTSTNRGGGIYNRTYGGALFIANTTVWGNTVALAGGGLYSENSDTYLSNSVFHGNSAGSMGPQLFIAGPASVGIEYSNVAGGLAEIGDCSLCPNWTLIWGPGNVDADPLLVDPENGNFRLLHGSPCIDSGDNLAVPEGVSTDLDGGPRFLDDPDAPDTGNPDPDAPKLPIVDMGPYEYDPDDCNNNDIPDADDIDDGTSIDCDENAIPDDCEVDCNNNGQVDACDVTQGVSDDCNGNIIPDECEVDCNNNGQQDDCDITDGSSDDCDTNGVPDECDPDCNDNGEVDACDILDGSSNDCGSDNIPDECQPGPPIIEQPADADVQAGDFVFFTVQADGALLFYQWRKDGVELTDTDRIIGTTLATLFILDVRPLDAGAYDCVVTDLFGPICTTTEAATLTVLTDCPADFDNTGAVGPFDLAILLGNWGPNPNHPADLNDDDIIDAADLALLLGNWGPCE